MTTGDQGAKSRRFGRGSFLEVFESRGGAAPWQRRMLAEKHPNGLPWSKLVRGRRNGCGVFCAYRSFVHSAANVGFEPILWKNSMLRTQNVGLCTLRERLSYPALRSCCGAGKILASLRRFWVVAARRNSSFAPHGLCNRSRPSPRICLRWAKSISTILRSVIKTSYCSVLVISRAILRVSSCSSRVILRASALGQHFDFERQDWQVNFKA